MVGVPMISNEKVDQLCREFVDAVSEQHGQTIIGHVHLFMAEPAPGKAATIVLNYIPDENTTFRNAVMLQEAMLDFIKHVIIPQEEKPE